jgi:hypothetical protein
VPNKSTVQRLVESFRETGSIGEKRRSGRPSVLSNDSLEDIRARLLQSPGKSLRKLSQQTGMTYGSVQRATKRLKLRPYRDLLPHGLRDFWIILYLNMFHLQRVNKVHILCHVPYFGKLFIKHFITTDVSTKHTSVCRC